MGKMKRSLIIFLLISLAGIHLFAQEKKPTLMILPSDQWCEQRYFMSTYNNQGIKTKTPNYRQAFLEDSELTSVISKLGGMLTAMGYSLKDAEQETKAVYNRMAEDNVTMSSTSMSSLAESPLDIIKRRAKMDILIQIWWKVSRSSGGNSVSFTIEAFDSYTSKRIATSTGTGKPSMNPVPELLEKAIKTHIKDFDKQMMSFYRDIQKNGREVVVTIKRWDSWENTLEYEINGEELTDIIRKWIKKHTINSNFNLSDATENMMQFEQVRIPLLDEDGDGMDARSFIVELRKYLSKEFGITSKVMTRGLGEGILVIGEK